ncbi:hypothetical protein SAMN04490239_9537 [Rhodococcus koreensis]|uniref:Uncharacterized protein n=1 Tax=Rhodococcus koreensis TaxID=99653 RepID=A0A1H5F898_9NOCA|nr:hypothetical protein SAMN04490239_9537 [Rhodococcus koreensis]
MQPAARWWVGERRCGGVEQRDPHQWGDYDLCPHRRIRLGRGGGLLPSFEDTMIIGYLNPLRTLVLAKHPAAHRRHEFPSPPGPAVRLHRSVLESGPSSSRLTGVMPRPSSRWGSRATGAQEVRKGVRAAPTCAAAADDSGSCGGGSIVARHPRRHNRVRHPLIGWTTCSSRFTACGAGNGCAHPSTPVRFQRNRGIGGIRRSSAGARDTEKRSTGVTNRSIRSPTAAT